MNESGTLIAPRLTLKESLVVGGLAMLCAAAGLSLILDHPSAGATPVADAVDLLRRWVSS